MPTLTIEAIRDNPWNVITHALPPAPTELLLELACLASAYCRQSEYLLMLAARKGKYRPLGWEPRNDSPDIHEESEARCCNADTKLTELSELYAERFGRFLNYFCGVSE